MAMAQKRTVTPQMGKIPRVVPRAAEKASCFGSAPLGCQEENHRHTVSNVVRKYKREAEKSSNIYTPKSVICAQMGAYHEKNAKGEKQRVQRRRRFESRKKSFTKTQMAVEGENATR